jgi:DNA-binding transcriptional regulator YdaS (Cro superfamily)
MYDESLLKAVQYFGSQRKLAVALNVTQPTVNHWINRSKKIPYLQALKISLYTNGNIRMEDLCDEEKELTFLLKHAAFLKGAPVAYLPLKEIIKGDKQCPIYRDFQETTASIASAPVSERPVLVSSNNQLIACECRLRSYKSFNSKVKVFRLNTLEILKNGSNIDSLLCDFPMSERVEVGLFIEKELGNRRGKRTDLKLPDNYPEVVSNNETREWAAMIAGFGSEFSYRQAKEILKNGIPELIKSVDDGLLAISKGRQIVRLPEKEQYLFIAMMHQKENNRRR